MANRYLVLVGLIVAGSSAHAAPSHRKPAVDAKPRAAAAAVDDDDGDDDIAMDADRQRELGHARQEASPPDVADSRPRPASAGWTFALGPYVWASSVQADVAFGPVTAGVDLGFLSIVRHTRYGIEAVLEARRGRFAITGDIMYGEAAFGASTTIASVMTAVTGRVGGLLLDSAVSYALVGGDSAVFSLEARSGVRYQRNTAQGEVNVAGFTVQTPEIVDSGADLVLGGRAVVRPTPWLQVAAMFDHGVVGVSDSTWSATVDASVRLSSRVLVTAGWRSLTMRRSIVTIELSGPRFAAQYLF